MTREQLIKAYEKLAYDNEEYDSWDDDIEPQLKTMTTAEIKKNYELDKKWFEERKHMVQA